MAIKIFTFSLLILSLGAYFIPVENMKKNIVDKDAPLVIFESPFIYTISEDNINRVIYATHAIKYQNRDEMYNADILLKNIDKTQDFKNEKLKADLIVKKGDNYTLTDNVKYTRDDFIKLNTNELFYDDIKNFLTQYGNKNYSFSPDLSDSFVNKEFSFNLGITKVFVSINKSLYSLITGDCKLL